MELWKDLLLPCAAEGAVSGEIFNGTCLNINSKKDLVGLDEAISER